MSIYSLFMNEEMVYPGQGPLFRPATAYPEYPFGENGYADGENAVYDGVRKLFHLSGLDVENYGTSNWNPLGKYVRHGDRVLVKPNLVMHANPTGNGTDCLYTHPSVIAAVVDYVAIALSGTGSIVLADAPMQSCDFDALVRESGLSELVAWYRERGLNISLKDMRGLKSNYESGRLEQVLVEGVEGKVIDLGEESSFWGLSHDCIDGLRITNYDPRELKSHHTQDRHEYFISQDLLDTNVVINLPKAKTHRKAGITGALKNMVGVNVRKEYLPHHMNGSAVEGADEYEHKSAFKRISSVLLDKKNEGLASSGTLRRKALGFILRGFNFMGKRASGDPYSEGSWWGNDTIWRTVLDLNKIVFYADNKGSMRDEQQRRMLVLCDMVTIGQGEGPLLPEPGEWHMLAFSDNPTTHDAAMARIMGTDERLIPTVHHALEYQGKYAWEKVDTKSVHCASNVECFNECALADLNADLYFSAKPTSGWSARFKREE